MTAEQVREIVKITIDELTKRKMIDTENYYTKIRTVEVNLFNYFDDKDNGMSHILNSLSDDPYIDIIFLQYRDGKTLEWVAEYYNKDVSTIKRNKKRLILKMYEMLEDS